jgi:WXG100 family type VII secretion target
MTAELIRAQYDQLQAVSVSFDDERDRIYALHGRLLRQVDILRRGGWQAEGADDFYRQMDADVLPGVERLRSALEQAGSVTRQIIMLLQNAEEDAAAFLRRQGREEEGTVGSGGGDGVGLTPNDEPSDDVTDATLTPNDRIALAIQEYIERLYGVQIAFPTSEQTDMPLMPGDTIPDPAKPGLRTITVSDISELITAMQQLRELREYGVDLTQTDGAHWTPAEIAQIHAAVTMMGQEAYDRAVELGLIEEGEITPAQAFAAVYTAGDNGLTFERSADNRHGGTENGAYAWNSNGTITMYDAAFYGQQTTGTGAQRGVYFTPFLIAQHEISHQINFIHTINGQAPATVYGDSFTYVEGQGYGYTFEQDHTFVYRNDAGEIRLAHIEAGETVYLPNADSGYGYRVRTFVEGDDAYNAAEAVTDGHVAEVAPPGAYTYQDGIHSYNDELFGRAREEVNQEIFDAVLEQIDWEQID